MGWFPGWQSGTGWAEWPSSSRGRGGIKLGAVLVPLWHSDGVGNETSRRDSGGVGIKGPAISLVRIIAVNEAMEAGAGWGVRAWELCRHPWASQWVPGSGGQGFFPGHPAAMTLLCICKGARGIIRSRCHPATAAWEPLTWGNFSHGCWVGEGASEHTRVCE